MKSLTTLSNELRIGTWRLSRAFNREHFKILRLIKKHKQLFEGFGVISIRRVTSNAAGRPVDELMLNNQQILFLMSLLRSSGNFIDLKAKAISAGAMVEILQAINDFDFDESTTRFVYVASDRTGRIKIGISNDPVRRVKELNIGNAELLRLLFTREANGVKYSDETLLHKQCEKYHIRSEWFTSEALEEIEWEAL